MTQYLFLRHGEASNHQEDHERPLSERGKEQASKVSFKNYFCDLIVTSSAKRCVETATIIKEKRFPLTPLRELKELYLPQKNPDLKTVLKMLDTLQEANLSQYLAADRDGAWKRYCKEAYTALTALVDHFAAEHVLVVAHANIINDVALQIDPEAGELRALYFAPCTGFVVQPHHQVQFIF